jgi:hypothetical protein
VINLRLKGNAMFWKSDHAESMLQVRSQVMPDQRDVALQVLSEFPGREAYDGWDWTPDDMSIKHANTTTLAT